jgi:hypothetical protein
MRFGKTFASYQLAKKMGWKKVLVLTFKPAVQSAWEEDLQSHLDFKGWQFISRNGLIFEEANPKKPIVCFGSFQDYLGKNNSTGGIKTKNEWVHATQLGLRFLTNTIMVLGVKMPKICLKQKVKRNWNLAKEKVLNILTKKRCQ